MVTEIIEINQTIFDSEKPEKSYIEDLKKAAHILKDGGLVAFPTETVYGIGANALDEVAVSKIYKAKGRPSDNPLIIHIGTLEELNLYAKYVPDYAEQLITAFWPGPLTLIFKKQPIIPSLITGGLETVAIRMPKNPIALKLIQLAGIPIAAPSANISGKPSPTRGYHVIDDLLGKVDMIIDGGSSDIGLESTVLDVSHTIPVILRPGSITKTMLEAVVDRVDMDPHLSMQDMVPKSPGMKYKHYAPKGHLIVYSGPVNQVAEMINQEVLHMKNKGYEVGVIATSEHLKDYKCDIVLDIGSEHEPKVIAANLFELLRTMDDLNVDYIYTRAISDKDIGHATMNRLLKAAGNNLIEL
jgi:L-threonylcarbamoyladenylate synthase